MLKIDPARVKEWGAYDLVLYCHYDDCPAREVEVTVKIHTDLDRDKVLQITYTCPICKRELKLHEVR